MQRINFRAMPFSTMRLFHDSTAAEQASDAALEAFKAFTVRWPRSRSEG